MSKKIMRMASSLLTMFVSVVSVAAEPPLEAPYTRPSSSSTSGAIERPTEIDKDTNDYYYKPVDKDGTIQYELPEMTAIKGAVFLRFGTIGPFDIESDTNDATYKNIYTDSASPLVYIEWEKQLGHFLGKWTLKLGTGVTTENGQGRFANNATETPREKFLFVVMPNTAMLNYKLRFSDKQFFIPYVEGGAGYFTFVEHRNDGEHTAFGGAGVLAAAGGILFSITALDKQSANVMYNDYGIKQLWLDLQFRHNQGLDNKKDFSSNMITGGFGFAF